MTDERAIEILNSLKEYYNDKNEDSYVGFDDEDNEAVDKAIESLKQTRWIPVSEELPKKSGKYWCTFGGTNLTGIDSYTTEPDAKKLFDNSEEYTGWQSQNVLAWMPLPQSYAESEE